MTNKKPKVCQRCKGKKGPKYQRRMYCGKCWPTVQRERKDKAHRRSVAKRYGIDTGAYDRILEVQQGYCPICLRANGRTKRLSVDHDHACCSETPACGKCTRGILCAPCNRMLGHARDEPEFFERAADYLRNPPAKGVLNVNRRDS